MTNLFKLMAHKFKTATLPKLQESCPYSCIRRKNTKKLRAVKRK
jgi:hypothetical protein